MPLSARIQMWSRRTGFIVILALVGLVIGVMISGRSVTSYESQATILIQPLSGNPYSPETPSGRTDQLAAMETEAYLVTTQPVADLAVQSAAPTPLPEQAGANASTTVPPNTQTIRIAYVDTDPAVAQAGAQAFATSYLQLRSDRAKAADAKTLAELQRQIADASQQLQDVSRAIGAAGAGSLQATVLQQQADLLAGQLARLNIESANVQAAARNPGEVISPAQPGQVTAGLPGWVLPIGAALAGALLGLGLARWRESRDPRAGSADDIRALGLPRPIGDLDLGAPAHLREEVLAGVRGALLAESTTICAVVPVTAGLASGATAFELAASVERSQRPVLLMTASPSLPPEWSALDGEPGMTDLCERDGSQTMALMHQVEGRLFAMGPGTRAPEAVDIFAAPAFREEVDELAHWIHVIMDCPSPDTAVGRTLAACAQVALLVVQYERTRLDEIVDAVELLHQAGVTHIEVLAVRNGSGQQLPTITASPASPQPLPSPSPRLSGLSRGRRG